MIKSEQLMNEVFETVSERTTVHDALNIMRENDYRILPVVEDLLNRKFLGQISDLDILMKVFAEGKDPRKTLVEWIYDKVAVVCGVETTIDDALVIMLKNGITRLPVVDDRNYIRGVLTAEEINRTPRLKFTWEKLVASADERLFQSDYERERKVYESKVEIEMVNLQSMLDIMNLRSRIATHEGDVNIERKAIFDDINSLREDLEESFKSMCEAPEDVWYQKKAEFESCKHQLNEKLFYLKEPIEQLVARNHTGMSTTGPIRSTR